MFGFDRITHDPDILGGKACIRGMRISVSLIVRSYAVAPLPNVPGTFGSAWHVLPVPNCVSPVIVNLVANGMTVKEIIREYPDLEPEDIRQALRYASVACRWPG